MNNTLIRQETFEVEHCCSCGMAFAMTSDFMSRRDEDHKTFWCPAGHPQHYTSESDRDRAQRLASLLDMERTRLAERDKQLDYARRAAKATGTRLRKLKQRVSDGVCPCCNRTFQNLAAHMSNKHPRYAEDADHA